jgi:hypothetical protein
LVLADALTLNEAALKLPFQVGDRRLVLAHNIWEHYVSLLQGDPVALREAITCYVVDRTSASWDTIDAWCQHLIWCENKDKRGYLYRVYGGFDAQPRPTSALAFLGG